MTERPESVIGGAAKRLGLLGLIATILVALLGVLAPAASASTLLRPETRVAAIEQPNGQLVGPHASVLAVQGRERAPNYDQDATGSSVAAESASAGATYDQMPLFIQARGAEIAVQSTEPEALAARDAVLRGDTTLYKGGNVNSLPPEESQFFAMENPENPGYGDRYGIPPKNLPFDWISSGQLEPGAPFITRPAPGVEGNLGGGIEVVTWPGSFIPGEP